MEQKRWRINLQTTISGSISKLSKRLHDGRWRNKRQTCFLCLKSCCGSTTTTEHVLDSTTGNTWRLKHPNKHLNKQLQLYAFHTWFMSCSFRAWKSSISHILRLFLLLFLPVDDHFLFLFTWMLDFLYFVALGCLNLSSVVNIFLVQSVVFLCNRYFDKSSLKYLKLLDQIGAFCQFLKLVFIISSCFVLCKSVFVTEAAFFILNEVFLNCLTIW